MVCFRIRFNWHSKGELSGSWLSKSGGISIVVHRRQLLPLCGLTCSSSTWHKLIKWPIQWRVISSLCNSWPVKFDLYSGTSCSDAVWLWLGICATYLIFLKLIRLISNYISQGGKDLCWMSYLINDPNVFCKGWMYLGIQILFLGPQYLMCWSYSKSLCQWSPWCISW